MTEVFLQLTLSVVLGGVLGLERSLAGKTAGIRTFALVALGSTLFSLMSKYGFTDVAVSQGFDPSRIASQIVVGVGFIGAGVIIFSKARLRGLTTAAGLWVSAALGMAVAFKMYTVAVFASLLTLVIFVVVWHLEHYFEKKFGASND